ncbi:MAG: hypothetical protein J6C86_10520 [Bacteroidaceae bacterium]|nr:hypothetical protein [Bacteroidaceae bacterium]
MVKKNFIGVMTPCVATALFMSGIMFTGCSKDDDFEDWDEETVQTLAEQRMTRSAEGTNPTISTGTLKASKDFTETFQFPIPTGSSYVGSCGYRKVNFHVSIYQKEDETYTVKITTKDQDISLVCQSLSVNYNKYTVSIDASIDNPAHGINLHEPECFHSYCSVQLP